MERKAGFHDILNAEQKVELQSYNEFGKFYTLFAECMDALLALLYIQTEQPKDLESDDYTFYFFVRESYAHAPFSLRSINILMSKGQYQEAMNLCRSVIENLVNCKYLFFNIGHSKVILKGDRFKIEDCWDYIAGPGAYKKIYKLLCKVEHKNFGYGNAQYRLNASFLNRGFYPVPSFDKIQAGAIINYTLYLMYGYLNLFSLFFIYEHNTIDSKITVLMPKLGETLVQQEANHFIAEEWFLIMRKIVDNKSQK